MQLNHVKMWRQRRWWDDSQRQESGRRVLKSVHEKREERRWREDEAGGGGGCSVQRGQQGGQELLQPQHLGGCWRTKAQGGDGQTASGSRVGQEGLTGGVGRVSLGSGQLICSCFHFGFDEMDQPNWEPRARPHNPGWAKKTTAKSKEQLIGLDPSLETTAHGAGMDWFQEE